MVGRKIKKNPEAVRFRERGPILVNEQHILSDDVVATGCNAYTPAAGLMPDHMQEEDDREMNTTDEENTTDQAVDLDATAGTEFDIPNESQPKKHRRSVPPKDMKRKKKNYSTADKIAKCLERMVDTMETDPNLSKTSAHVEAYYVQACLDVLETMAGIDEGGCMLMFALRLFLKPVLREVFLGIKKDDLRLKWLQDQMERDNMPKQSSGRSTGVPRGYTGDNDHGSSS